MRLVNRRFCEIGQGANWRGERTVGEVFSRVSAFANGLRRVEVHQGLCLAPH